ncbi:MAG: repair protein [Flaviaesturariibacter sp.]|nr:repair protein [Flaviaesturariibacter sp.]
MTAHVKVLPLGKVSEIELTYTPKVKNSERPVVLNAEGAIIVFQQNWEMDKINLLEQFKVLFLNRAHKVLGILHLSSGGITGTVADVRLIFAAAIKANAVSIIIAHNHPSGVLKPSSVDMDITQKIKSAGKILDVALLDHLIVSSEGFYSFADEGLL